MRIKLSQLQRKHIQVGMHYPRRAREYVLKIGIGIRERAEEITDSVVAELGSARSFSEYSQVVRSAEELEASVEALKQFDFMEEIENATIIKEGFGCCSYYTVELSFKTKFNVNSHPHF